MSNEGKISFFTQALFSSSPDRLPLLLSPCSQRAHRHSANGCSGVSGKKNFGAQPSPDSPLPHAARSASSCSLLRQIVFPCSFLPAVLFYTGPPRSLFHQIVFLSLLHQITFLASFSLKSSRSTSDKKACDPCHGRSLASSFRAFPTKHGRGIPLQSALISTYSSELVAGDLSLQMLGMHGTFDDRVTGKVEAFASRAKIMHIDIDPAEIRKNKLSHVSIQAFNGVVLSLSNNSSGGWDAGSEDSSFEQDGL
ncbi:hypothetical protein ACLOJK_009084 [Asimina triloba]